MMLFYTLCLMAALLIKAHAGCSNANWWSSFDRTGLSKCDSGSDLITGFYRNRRSSKDHLYLLEEASCCSRPYPWSSSSNIVVHANWWQILDANNRWGKCPEGYFLNGLYRNENNPGWLHNIEEGRCVKPADAPNRYQRCYDHDVEICFDNIGWCKCNSGYYVTGVYRNGCDALYCLKTLHCCKPASSRETLDELFKVKTYVMEITLRNMALLAHYMGYGWCAGCRSDWVGDDFVRTGDTWNADKSMRCSGHKSGHRLGLAFGDWSFGNKQTLYGTAVIEELRPESVDDGIIENNDKNEATKTVTRSEVSIRSVTHTTTSSWKMSHELGITVSYTPPDSTGGVGGSVSYTFGYESGSTTTDSTQQQQSKTFTVSSSKVLDPFSSVRFQLVLTKIRSTLPYTALILARFSTEFRGFLRWGGGSGSINTNYHASYKGSGDRPTVNYKFGDENTPFYTDLYRQSSTASRPWLWHELKNNHNYVNTLINRLTDENSYTIRLTGKFEDVIGKQVHFTWGPVTRGKRSEPDAGNGSDDSAAKTVTHVARAGPDDSPAPDPPAPQVDEPGNSGASVEPLEIQVNSSGM
ncbi:biomphalysin [Plakobranchus ocellatus]|uniref:Biomphalysin n=1 Tax=Plakobranchus ocellatus TaxID=259542 RepID=A0AAV4BJA1_9GAST|nr:biomphalysin [Plakobranchus ocellatus]